MNSPDQGARGKRPAFWLQHPLDFDGMRKNNVYWRPTRHGVDWIDDGHRVSENGYWYVAQVNAGWNGTTNRALKRGVMFLMDYNDLQQLYDNTAATTTEWMYDDVAVPAGKTWSTTIKMIPAEGFATFTYGSAQLLGAFEATQTLVRFAYRAHAGRGGQCVEKRHGEDARTGRTHPVDGGRGQLHHRALGMAPLAHTTSVTGVGPLPCVVTVTVSGTDAGGKPLDQLRQLFRRQRRTQPGAGHAGADSPVPGAGKDQAVPEAGNHRIAAREAGEDPLRPRVVGGVPGDR